MVINFTHRFIDVILNVGEELSLTLVFGVLRVVGAVEEFTLEAKVCQMLDNNNKV